MLEHRAETADRRSSLSSSLHELSGSEVQGVNEVLMLLDISPAHDDHEMARSTSCSKQCMDCEMQEHRSTDRGPDLM